MAQLKEHKTTGCTLWHSRTIFDEHAAPYAAICAFLQEQAMTHLLPRPQGAVAEVHAHTELVVLHKGPWNASDPARRHWLIPPGVHMLEHVAI